MMEIKKYWKVRKEVSVAAKIDMEVL